MSDHIAVVPYDPAWIARFEEEQARLEEALAPWLIEGVHHIGSTAIPGLSAKPIIDMLAGVRDLAQARDACAPLRTLSYVDTPHRPGIAHHFSKPSARLSETTHGLHLTEPGSDLWRERLAFRDALRDHPALLSGYEQLKLRLAREHPGDLVAYTAGKREFVGRVLATRELQFGDR
ncbi:MAG: GrpB family protein [Actinobacteria bacterium]|nr:GrpB family protein [Actinomycetota bacterium]